MDGQGAPVDLTPPSNAPVNQPSPTATNLPLSFAAAAATGTTSEADDATPAKPSPLPLIFATLQHPTRWTDDVKAALIKELWSRIGRTSIPQIDFDARRAVIGVRAKQETIRSALHPIALGNGLAPIILTSSLDPKPNSNSHHSNHTRSGRPATTRIKLTRLPIGYTDEDIRNAFKLLEHPIQVEHIVPDMLEIKGEAKSGIRLSSAAVYIPLKAPLVPPRLRLPLASQPDGSRVREVYSFDRRDPEQVKQREEARDKKQAHKRNLSNPFEPVAQVPALDLNAMSVDPVDATTQPTSNNQATDSGASSSICNTTTSNSAAHPSPLSDAALAAQLQEEEHRRAHEQHQQIASDAAMATSLREEDREERAQEEEFRTVKRTRPGRRSPSAPGSPTLSPIVTSNRWTSTVADSSSLAVETGMTVDEDSTDATHSGETTPTN